MQDTELTSGNPCSTPAVVIKGSDVLWVFVLSIVSILAYVVGIFVVRLTMAILGYSSLADAVIDHPDFGHTYVFCFYICAVIFVYGIVVQHRSIGWRDLGFVWFDYRRIRIALVVAGLYFSVLAAGKLYFGRPLPFDEFLPSTELNTLSVLLVIISYVPGAGVVEEILFRGLLYRWLRQTRSALAANCVSSVAFGISHFYFIDPGGWLGWGGTVSVGLFGAFAAHLFEKTGSLWPAIACHVMNNFLLISIGVINALR